MSLPELDSRPAQLPRGVTLEGRRCSVVPLDPAAHAGELYEATCGPANEALWRYLPDGPYDDFGPFATDIAAKAASLDPLYFAIVDRVSRRAAGHAAYLRIDQRNRVVEIGHILFGAPLQRTAAATEAMYLMSRYVFEELGYRRYEWKCDALNLASYRAAERFGFTHEGTFRQHMIRKGRNRDTAWFSMLDSEWPAIKAGFEAWLDPVNFDAGGRQQRSLASCRRSGEQDRQMDAGALTVTADPTRVDADFVHRTVSSTYWAEGRSRETVERTIRHSLCFSAFIGTTQVGFARVVSDRAVFAYLMDVVVSPEHRRRGVATALMEAILAHPALQDLSLFMLRTRDAHGLYAKFGFAPVDSASGLMARSRTPFGSV